MFPTEPQSFANILFNSLKTYKRILVNVFPLSVLLTTTYISESILLLLLNVFCFCWMICFVANFVENENFDYKKSLQDFLERSFKAAALFIVATILLIIVAVAALGFWYVGMLIKSIPFVNIIFMIIFLTVVGILFIAVMCFMITSIFDVLIKDSSLSVAIKRAFQMSSSLPSILRFFGFFLIISFFTLVVFTPAYILILLPLWTQLNAVITFTIGIFTLFLTMALLWIPLKVSVLLHLYNDLVLRFAEQK